MPTEINQTDYLIIGGGIAGTTAAETVRSLDPVGSITIISDENEPLYSRVAIKVFVQGKRPEEKMYLRTTRWYHEQRIELLAGRLARALDTHARVMELDGRQVIAYRRLLLTIGGYPNFWGVRGAKLDGVYPWQTFDDSRKIKHRLSLPHVKAGVVVGGGLIAVDMVHAFRGAGLQTVALVREPYFFGHLLDRESGLLVQRVFEENGVETITGDVASELLGEGEVEEVVTRGGRRLPCNIVGVGIGISPDFGFLRGSGLEIRSGIVTDAHLETRAKGVFAAGDCAEFYDLMYGYYHRMGSWANAAKQGRVAGANMVGKGLVYRAVTSYTTNFFNYNITFVGEVDTARASQVVSRGSAASGRYGRLLIKDAVIIGATLINLAGESSALTNLISAKVDVSRQLGELAYPEFKLSSLLPTALRATAPVAAESA